MLKKGCKYHLFKSIWDLEVSRGLDAQEKQHGAVFVVVVVAAAVFVRLLRFSAF